MSLLRTNTNPDKNTHAFTDTITDTNTHTNTDKNTYMNTVTDTHTNKFISTDTNTNARAQGSPPHRDIQLQGNVTPATDLSYLTLMRPSSQSQ